MVAIGVPLVVEITPKVSPGLTIQNLRPVGAGLPLVGVVVVVAT